MGKYSRLCPIWFRRYVKPPGSKDSLECSAAGQTCRSRAPFAGQMSKAVELQARDVCESTRGSSLTSPRSDLCFRREFSFYFSRPRYFR